MKNCIIYLSIFICLLVSKSFAQDQNPKIEQAQQTFETRAKAIATNIENITKTEKEALKVEVEAINKMLENGTISSEEATQKKQSLAEARATIIENKIAIEQQALKDLVQEKVDGKISENKKFVITYGKSKRDTIPQSERRTTSQFVFAIGANNVLTNKNLASSEFKFASSRFYEWGLTANTRLLKDKNLLHLKYGLSLMYNDLKPTNNRVFVDSGTQTNLETSPIQLDDSRFRNVSLVVPVHFEFDFSKNKTVNDKPFFFSHQAFRFGIGGFVGLNVKSKQILKYEIDNQNTIEKTRGDFNANDFVYGVSTYIGYKETSLYLKYDLNPLFKNNTLDQNNISLGLRFDLN